jgi:adenylylsulfate kinase
VFCNCPLDICEQRDVKGLYKRARAGEIQNYTGISAPYEEPANPDINIETGTLPLMKCVENVIDELRQRGIVLN